MKNLKLKAGLLLTGVVASASSFAADHTAAITAAETDGSLNVTAASTAVIAVVAIIFGVNLVISMFKK
jgi:hypothetical protein